MPELPEVETLARDLNRALNGRTIRRVTVARPNVVRVVTPRMLARRLAGSRVVRVWRRAKHAVFDLSSGDRMVVQPRFTGGFLVGSGSPLVDRYITVRFELTGGGEFAYRDVRRLGTVSLLDPAEFERFDRRMGVEPLDDEFTVETLSAFLRSSRQAIKKTLMDQHRVVGVGNIYANESLWLAGIDPSRPSHLVSNESVAKLRDAVVKVLRQAIRARGTTFRDFRDAYGESGEFANRLAVYGRERLPCRRCGTRLAGTHAIDGRATVFCFRCQP